jgi:hypothetical protein
MIVICDKFEPWLLLLNQRLDLFLILNILAIRVGGKKPWKIPGEDHFSGMLNIVFIKRNLE